ncbi:hypothetical protein JVU11DRAFT_7696 [Chiua virens]|nr:hypothetical protein JVU11DRAFT_7696 [Chiua virens]
MEVKNRNQQMVSATSAVAQTKLAKFTPVPEKGFPMIHLAAPGQLVTSLSATARAEWINVDHPKVLIRVFDYDGTDPTKINPILTRKIERTIKEIATAYNMRNVNCAVSPPTPAETYPIDTIPNAFLVHQITGEIRDILVGQRIWSSEPITLEARPFVERAFPTLLFNLAGFTTTNGDIVHNAIYSLWSDPEVCHMIFVILNNNDPFFKQEAVIANSPQIITKFINSMTIEFLDYKVARGIETPRYNVHADSPTAHPGAWTSLREFLTSLKYPTSLHGTGAATYLSSCTLCHSASHPRGLCEFPNIPNWNGPLAEPKSKGGPKNKNNAMKGKWL